MLKPEVWWVGDDYAECLCFFFQSNFKVFKLYKYYLNCIHFQTVSCMDCGFKDKKCHHMPWIMKVNLKVAITPNSIIKKYFYNRFYIIQNLFLFKVELNVKNPFYLLYYCVLHFINVCFNSMNSVKGKTSPRNQNIILAYCSQHDDQRRYVNIC